ncbi:MAG TPA: flagellin [Desulfobacteraceae bacterium]|nr:flagellin [Desulfobacteraceae bacterium]
MALTINTNVAALNAHQKMIKNDNALSSSLGRLSTGLRINKAADDASGMMIADSLRAQHMGIGQAVKNANDGISMVQTADGALEESINIINTIKTKSIQAATDSQTTETRKAIQADIDALMEELDTIAKTTSYNGQNLLSGVFTNKSIHIGAYSGETASVSIGSAESAKIGHVSTSNLSLASDTGGEVQLTITSNITGNTIDLNTIDMQMNNSAENGMGALADEVNAYAAETGINAVAVVSTTTGDAISAGTTGSDFSINGITIGAIDVDDNDGSGSLVAAINDKTTEHGVTAAMNSDGTMTLTSSDGRAIDVDGSISDVFGSTSSQMSTFGYLQLTQSGSAEFQINGIGSGATGADLTIQGATTMTEESILAAGSTIDADSTLAAGTILGADVTTTNAVSSTQLDFELVSGSVLAGGTVFAENTVLGGTVTTDSANALTTNQDMLVASGSTLTAGTILDQGTVVTTEFTVTSGASNVTYSVGDTLTSDVTLSSDLTLQSDMTLESDNGGSTIASGSTLTAGTVAGMNITSEAASSTTLSEDMTLESGSTLANNSVLLAGSELGDEITVAATVSTYETTTLATGSMLDDGSILAEGSTIGATITVGSAGSAATTIESDMTVKSGSTLASGSVIAAGTTITTAFTETSSGTSTDYAVGDVLTDDVTISGGGYTLSEDMTLKEDSKIGATSTLTINTDNAGTVGLSDTEFMRLSDLSVLTQEDAEMAIEIADAALADLDSIRSSLGSVQNQLTSTISNLSTTKTNIQASESAIRDVDFAEEASTYSKLNLLSQTSSYALAQANASSQNVMSLLQ